MNARLTVLDLPSERVALHRPRGIPEAVALAVDDSTRKWREVHQRYTVATVLKPRHGTLSQGEVHYRNWRYATEPGVLMLMEPSEVHATQSVTGLATFRLLQIDPGLIERAAQELDLPTPVHWRSPVCRDPEIFAGFARLHALIEHGGTPEQQEAQFVVSLRALLLEYAEQRRSTLTGEHASPLGTRVCSSASRKHVRHALGYIHDKYQARITLSDLASACGLSRFRMDQVFSGCVGLSPLQYQLELRLAQARTLLAAGQRPSEIAHEVGFYDHSQFSRLFKRSVGLSPMRYAQVVRSTRCVD